MSDSIVHLNGKNFKQEIEKGTVLVDFHADWCGPCRMLAPELKVVAKDLHGTVKVAKVDIDADSGLAGEYKVTSVPTMVIFKNGKEVHRMVGLRDADGIKEALDNV